MNKFNNILGQILKIYPRTRFEIFVKETNASVNAKGFSCWDQFVPMHLTKSSYQSLPYAVIHDTFLG